MTEVDNSLLGGMEAPFDDLVHSLEGLGVLFDGKLA